MGILLEYGWDGEIPKRSSVELRSKVRFDAAKPVAGFLGAGNYAGRILIPAFQKAGAVLKMVAASGGVNAVHYGKKYGFQQATAQAKEVLEDNVINTVVVATRHDSHASFVCEALTNGKHVFVEKPLCLSLEELEQIRDAYGAVLNSGMITGRTAEDRSSVLLMVGFNRRFAPHVQKMKSLLQNTSEPKSFVVTVNAGEIPADHWTQDPVAGGGRIIGEACHFIDLLRFLAGVPISSIRSFFMGRHPSVKVRSDKAAIVLTFEDGSFGTIHYLANGHKSFPKERIEVFYGGSILQLDNFRKLTGFGCRGFKSMRLSRQDKGQEACAAAFVRAIEKGSPSPIPFEEIIEVARASINASKEALEC
jgi:predicted dehydrogenase